jgi:ABC-2 type transport system permease protein
MNATTMKWLLRREFWEYKGSMLWAPLAVAAVLVLLIGGVLLYGLADHHIPSRITINGQTVEHGTYAVKMSAETASGMARMASTMYLGLSLPLFGLLTAVIFSYCLGALHDERRDRSILFWKSLPVSDGMTVLSKVATALLVAPLITMALATLVSLLLLLIGCIGLAINGTNLFGALLTSPDLYLSPLRLLALLPVYIVWALPTVGWLLLVSSWARAKPIMWAVGAPLVGLLVVKWASLAMENLSGSPLNLMHYAQDLVARILTGIVPGIWFSFGYGLPRDLNQGASGIDMGGLVEHSYATLAGADAWLGALLGAAMLYGAIRLRRYRDEG